MWQGTADLGSSWIFQHFARAPSQVVLAAALNSGSSIQHAAPALAESQGLEIVVTLYHYIQLYNIFQDWNGQELGLNSEQTGH